MANASTRTSRCRRCAAVPTTAATVASLLLLSAIAATTHAASVHRDSALAVVQDGTGALPPPPQTFEGPGPGARLQAALVVFRHGARSPLSSAFYGDVEWDCDELYDGPSLELRNSAGGAAPPLVDADTPALAGGGCTQGTLTQRGYQMAVELGRELRGRYVDELALLPEGFEEGRVFAQTTMFRRTIATLRVGGCWRVVGREGSCGLLVRVRIEWRDSAVAAAACGESPLFRTSIIKPIPKPIQHTQGVLQGLYPAGPASYPVNATDEPHSFFYPSNRSCGALTPVIAKLMAAADKKGACGGEVSF